MSLTTWLLFAALPLVSHDHHAQAVAQEPVQPSAPHALADAEQPHGVLRLRVRGNNDEPMPCRLTFVPKGGGAPDLFPNTQAAPHELAVRENVVYTLSGDCSITVPVGTYSVYASRGMEYGIAAELLNFEAGAKVEWSPTLRREVPTAGWVSGDFHLHTLTHSGHGDSNLDERIISLIGEGVECAVATDHNHHTDYGPTVEGLGAEKQLKTIVGNEVSAPVGHLNAFPLDPERPVADAGATDANALFKFLRAEPNEFDVVPVIQLNHPRWGGIDYFTQTVFDPVTGTSSSPNYSGDFDTIEVLNSNPAWGYHDADTSTLPVGAGIHSVLQDWYNLLNRGHRYYAVGNSDSHTVRKMTAGYPRNYVASEATYPWQIDIAELASSLRAGRVFTTTGPFVEFTVNGQQMGDTVLSESGRVMVYVRLRMPQWMFVNRVKFVVNGEVWRTIELEPFVLESGEITWPILQEVLALEQDSWVHVIVEGDEPLEPMVTPQDRPILPLAITNPVWVHMSDSPSWRSPWETALIESGRRPAASGMRPGKAALFTLAAVEKRRPHATRIVQRALASPERVLQLAGIRGAEQLGDPAFTESLAAHYSRQADAFFTLAVTRALAKCDPDQAHERLLELFERFGNERLARYPNELDALLGGNAVRDWQVIGYFENPTGAELFEGEFGPLGDPADRGVRAGKSGEISWTARSADERGYLDLGSIDPATRDRSLSYARVGLRVDSPREVLYAMGSDDGARLWVNGAQLYADRGQHGASPLQQIGTASLQAGWNEVLIGVENGGGASGLYFRLLDSEVEVSAEYPQTR